MEIGHFELGCPRALDQRGPFIGVRERNEVECIAIVGDCPRQQPAGFWIQRKRLMRCEPATRLSIRVEDLLAYSLEVQVVAEWGKYMQEVAPRRCPERVDQLLIRSRECDAKRLFNREPASITLVGPTCMDRKQHWNPRVMHCGLP